MRKYGFLIVWEIRKYSFVFLENEKGEKNRKREKRVLFNLWDI